MTTHYDQFWEIEAPRIESNSWWRYAADEFFQRLSWRDQQEIVEKWLRGMAYDGWEGTVAEVVGPYMAMYLKNKLEK